MSMHLTFEPFDSALYGAPVARLTITSATACSALTAAMINEYIIEKNVSLLYGITPCTHQATQFMEQLGFSLVSTRTTYQHKAHSVPLENHLPDGFCITDAQHYRPTMDSVGMQELITQIGQISHYALDVHLEKSFYHAVYQQWFENSLNGYADQIYFITHNNDVAAMLTLKHKTEGLFIDILGVRSLYRGMGIASVLIAHAKQYTNQHNKDLFVSTQAENIPASATYQKNGFVIKNMELVYHKHIGNEKKGDHHVQSSSAHRSSGVYRK